MNSSTLSRDGWFRTGRWPSILRYIEARGLFVCAIIFLCVNNFYDLFDNQFCTWSFQLMPEKFPVNLNTWSVGFEGDPNDEKLNSTAVRLLKYLSDVEKVAHREHWCGKFSECARRVYQSINPAATSVLYPRNVNYLFLVRKIGQNLYGYQCYLPYKTFSSPSKTVCGAFISFAVSLD